ncbi:MAG: hypothetical protein OXF56_15290 [Rhodobacteraceae bacterium]|nr:hypothetical protein [Paracoccaceae bacterium]
MNGPDNMRRDLQAIRERNATLNAAGHSPDQHLSRPRHSALSGLCNTAR